MKRIKLVFLALCLSLLPAYGDSLLLLEVQNRTISKYEKIECELFVLSKDQSKAHLFSDSKEFDIKFNSKKTKSDVLFSSKFKLTPKSLGEYKVGPFELELNGEKLKSNFVTVKIVEKRDSQKIELKLSRSKVKVNEEVEIELVITNMSLKTVHFDGEKMAEYGKMDKTFSSTKISFSDGVKTSEASRKISFTPLKKGEIIIDHTFFKNLDSKMGLKPVTLIVE